MPLGSTAKKTDGGFFSGIIGAIGGGIKDTVTGVSRGAFEGAQEVLVPFSRDFASAAAAGLAGRGAQFLIEDAPKGRVDFATTGEEALRAAEIRRSLSSGGLVLTDGGFVRPQSQAPPTALLRARPELLIAGAAILGLGVFLIARR